MKNFSEINLTTNKEQVINMACSSTGLSDVIIGQIYESQKTLGKTDNEISDYFASMTTENFSYTSKEFIDEISKILSELSLNDGVDGTKHQFTMKFLQILTDYSEGGKLDSVNLLDTISEILIIQNPKAKEKLLPIMKLELSDTKVLNESFNQHLAIDNNLNVTQLFEGLKEILTKNNKRWGFSYHIQNSYNAIMNYVDEEIKEKELASKLYSVDDQYHIMILNEMLSGNVSPLYKNYHTVKELVPDMQSLVFDMTILVNRYFSLHDSSLDFVKKQTYNDYKQSASLLLQTTISSFASSRIISDFDKNGFLGKSKSNANQSNTEDYPVECSNGTYYFSNDDYLINKLTGVIDGSKLLNNNIWNISLKSVVDMLNFIKSASADYNLKIRPIIRTYITKGYELASSVENADRLLKKSSRY